MPTAIRSCQADDLPALHALYEAQVCGRVPHCFAVDADTFAAALGTRPDLPGDGGRRCLRKQALWCAADGSGFVHAGVEVAAAGGPPVGIVRFLLYARGRRAVGEALLDAGEAWLRGRGVTDVVAAPQAWRYPFHGYAHACLSDHLDHVQGLLRARGYARSGGEVFLDWPDMDPPAVADASGLDYVLRLQEQPGAGRLPGFRLTASAGGGASLGECAIVNAGEFSTDAAAQDVAFCDWLGVAPAHQGRGLGRFLLLAALREARSRGYRHGAISTAWDNDRAFLCYANYGFHVVDWTYEFRRSLP